METASTYLGRRDGRDEQVKGAGELGVPLGIVIRGDVAVGAHLERVCLLALLSRDGDDRLGPQRLGPHDDEMAQATEADDAHTLTRAAPEMLQRRIRGDAGAQHDRGRRRRDAVRDLEDKVARRAVVQGVAAVRLVAVQVEASVRAHVLGAKVFVSGGALLTGAWPTTQTGIALSADPDPVAHRDTVLHFAAHADGSPDDFVADAARVRRRAL